MLTNAVERNETGQARRMVSAAPARCAGVCDEFRMRGALGSGNLRVKTGGTAGGNREGRQEKDIPARGD